MLWLTRTKMSAHWPRKIKHINAQQKGKKIILRVGDHVLNINVFVKFVIPLIFTDVQRKGIRLLNKSNAVIFMYPWFVYVTTELWKVSRQGHFIFVIFINLTIGSVPITAMRWPSRGEFFLGLPEILFVANHTSREINAIICACQLLVEWEGYSFAHYLWNTWHHWFVVFLIVTTKCTTAARTGQPIDMLSHLASSKVLVVSDCPVAVGLL